MFWVKDQIKKNHKRYQKMNSERFTLQEKAAKDEVVDKKIEEIENFITNVYAKSIFDKYSKKKPKLICKKTDEVIDWEEAFGSEYDKISKSLRHSLVGLIEGGGRYRFH